MLEPVIQVANAAAALEPGDYEQNGLLYCGKCHTPKQSRQILFGKDLVVGCVCACAKQNYDKGEKVRKKLEEADRIMRLRCDGISSQIFQNACFAADDGKNPKPMDTLRRYRYSALRVYQNYIYNGKCKADDLPQGVPRYQLLLVAGADGGPLYAGLRPHHCYHL